jgi:formaldehyde-activating enzyme involved in methanogenesis
LIEAKISDRKLRASIECQSNYSLVDDPPSNLETPVVKDMPSDRFQHSTSRLWLTVVCASLTLCSALAKPIGAIIASTPTNRPSLANQAPTPAVIQSIRQAVKKQFGVAQVAVVSATEQNWPDGCLGLPKADEVCTMAVVTGWRVEVSDKLQTWFYRTDLTGKAIRLENPQRSMLPQPVASKLIQQVARETNTPSGKLRIAEVRAKTYDGCLGIYHPDRACTKIAIKGWQSIIVPIGFSSLRDAPRTSRFANANITSPDLTYVYHLSQNAEQIVQNATASGAKRKINVSFETFGTIAPLTATEIFSSSTSGDLTGRMSRIVLTPDGKITRYQSSPTARFAPVVIKTLSIDRLNAFKKTLADRQFPNFNGLTYLTSAALADYPTTTYQSQSTATQFIDLEKQSLPKSLRESIASWESLITPVK